MGMGMVLGVAFILLLLLIGDRVYRRRRTRDSVPRTEPKGTALESLLEKPWHVQVAVLLVAVWAVWLLAFVAWGWTVDEWHKPAANDEVYFGYTVLAVMVYIVAVAGVFAATLWPGWGAIVGGLLVTLLGQWGTRLAVHDLQHWGEGNFVLERGTPWVPLDDLAGVPFVVLLVAGVLLLGGGIVHVWNARHRPSPHAGAAA